MPRPWIVLEEAARRLNPGGVLLVAAPNPDAWQARLLKSYWPHHDMPRHLFALPIPWLVAFGQKNTAYPSDYNYLRRRQSLLEQVHLGDTATIFF